SGYAIVIEGDRVPLAKRMVTLETGEVTFWEAFDQLCRAANLSEIQTANVNLGQTIYLDDGVIIIRQPIQIQAVPAPLPQPVPAVKGGVAPMPAEKLPQN